LGGGGNTGVGTQGLTLARQVLYHLIQSHKVKIVDDLLQIYSMKIKTGSEHKEYHGRKQKCRTNSIH
jgi:hypothetical protein